MKMDENAYLQWYWNDATPEEKELYNRFATYFEDGTFDDMLFLEGSVSYDLIKCKSKMNNDEWKDDTAPVPEVLEYVTPTFFRTFIIDDGHDGSYDSEEQVIRLSSKYAKNDSFLLHEMIHLFEEVINELPLYFHDTLFWALYTNLRTKINGLDDAITEHAHILNEWDLYRSGGSHDTLFLLKSFDLDIRKGYPLGTVFAYGRTEDFKYLSYNKE